MDADRMQLAREQVRLDLLVESVLAEIPGAEGSVDVSSGEVVASVDPALLRRAVGNLVRNAMVHGQATRTTPAIATVSSGSSGATIRVTDGGPGIDPEVVDGVFDRFRSRTGSSGHGLGLPLARWIAQAHGGDLRVVSSTPSGTTFELALPSHRVSGTT